MGRPKHIIKDFSKGSVRLVNENFRKVFDELTIANFAGNTLKIDNSSTGNNTAGNIELVIGDNQNKLWLNNDNDGVLALGGTDKDTAPFRVTADGHLTATQATISGSVTATSGAIGGWTISSTELYSGSGATKVGLSTSGEYRIYAGADSPANAPFYVKSDGTVKAKNSDFFVTDDNSTTNAIIGSFENLINDPDFEEMYSDISNSTNHNYYITNIAADTYTEITSSAYKVAQSFLYTNDSETVDSTTYYNAPIAVGLASDLLYASTITVRIETDSSGSPSGTLAHPSLTTTISMSAENFSQTFTSGVLGNIGTERYYWFEVIFSNWPSPDYEINIPTGTYWIVISATDYSGSQQWRLACNSTSTYADGVRKEYNGSTWGSASGDLAFYVKTYDLDVVRDNDRDSSVRPYGYTFYRSTWYPINLPRMWDVTPNPNYFLEFPNYIGAGIGGAGDVAYFSYSDLAIFNRKTLIVNNENYIAQETDINENTTFTLSAYVAPRGGSSGNFYGNTSGSSLSVRLKVSYYDDFIDNIDTNLISSDYTDTEITSSYNDVTERNLVVRATHTFTTPTNTKYIKIEILSTSSEWIRVDGVQLCGGSYPKIYNSSQTNNNVNVISSYNSIRTNEINEYTTDAGVTIDGLNSNDIPEDGGYRDFSSGSWSNISWSQPLIQSGWGFVQGDGDDTVQRTGVRFAEAFDSVPIVIMGGLGIKYGSSPTSKTDFTAATIDASPISVTSSGFTAVVTDTRGIAHTSTDRLGFAWIAIGEKAR